jgi:aquaporin Z
VNDVSNARVLAAEALGTAILILGGPGSAILAGDEIGTLGIALAFGLSMVAAAYLIGNVSGCHVNPAVTLAMWIAQKVDGRRALHCVAGQLIGGIGGAAIIYGIASSIEGYEKDQFASNGWAQLSPGNYQLGAAMVVEVVFTAVLVAVVMSTTNKNFKAEMGPVAVGFTLTVIHLVTIPVDNTSVNPVRSLSTALFSDWDLDTMQQLWLFLVFPLIGAVIGVVAWLVVDDATLESTLLDTVPTRYARDRSDAIVDRVEAGVDDVLDNIDEKLDE